jgi:hypothetical protein
MADEAQKDVVHLAEQVAEGFAALSGEYQALFDQQKQLESKLSWAKQQVRIHIYPPTSLLVMKNLALDLQLLAALTENNHMYLTFNYSRKSCHCILLLYKLTSSSTSIC